MGMIVTTDGKKYQIGSVYFTGSVLQVIRHGDPRIITTEVASDELDSFAEDFPIRIYTNARKKRHQKS